MRWHEPLEAVRVVRSSLYDAWDALFLIGDAQSRLGRPSV